MSRFALSQLKLILPRYAPYYNKKIEPTEVGSTVIGNYTELLLGQQVLVDVPANVVGTDLTSDHEFLGILGLQVSNLTGTYWA